MNSKILNSFWAILRLSFSTRFLRLIHFIFFFVSLFILIEWQDEVNLNRNINSISQLRSANKSDTAIVVESMNSIRKMMKSRSEFFQENQILSLKQVIFQSTDIHLMYGSDACGGYSKAFARNLQTMGYNVRIGQLKLINGRWGGHIIIEYYSNLLKKWVMIDPIFAWIPRNKSGEMTDVDYVIKHWSELKNQMPSEIRDKFRFDDIRYTNWGKWNGILKPYYKLMKLIKGETYADKICLRKYALNTYFIYFWSIFGIYFILILVYLLNLKKKKTKAK